MSPNGVDLRAKQSWTISVDAWCTSARLLVTNRTIALGLGDEDVDSGMLGYFEPEYWSDLVLPHDGPRYMFRERLMVDFCWNAEKSFTARLARLNIGGKGNGRPTIARVEAVEDLKLEFQLLVQRNWFVPTHELTEDNRRVNELLAEVVDWDAYERMNPPTEYVWGRVDAVGLRGVDVYWQVGPGGQDDVEAVIERTDRLMFLADRHRDRLPFWFAGRVRDMPEGLVWVEEPHEVDEPSEERGAAAWDRFPVQKADEEGVWPLRKEGQKP